MNKIAIYILFFVISLIPFRVYATPASLAGELYEEKNYRACVAECERVLAEDPGNKAYLKLKNDAAKHLKKKAQDASVTANTPGIFSWPFLRLIGFYKKQISPALGDRCGLYPSCSSYGLQTIKKYGLLGLAMTADRLVREQAVIRNHQDVAVVNGKLKILDPMEDHDFWFTTNTHEK